MEFIAILIFWGFLGVLGILIKLNLNVFMFLKVFFLIVSVLLMIWNYRSIEDKIPTYDIDVERLMGRLLTKLIVHTILWTIFLVSFFLIMIS